ncbi:sulfate/molybdate ABC transporter ATP-binding protein [Demequina lutea]|uniref:Molybdate transport system ATP-binding protein n=1 Tax=Demequina lutea TaxID=431489 RepID=A0A7Z0CJT0_9MICO|nr:ATP-binding cassette domain-containing protein [Demequina lutea]NYI41040.1 molybdate transport system ATP-binding protein [Demequina lutea]
MTLDAVVGVSSRAVKAVLHVPEGTTLALLGPNGAGKTTVIEALAGLTEPDSGHATLGDAVLFSDRGGRMRLTESRSRGIALVTQDAALFPHVSVLDNVAFPSRSRGNSRADSRADAHEWLERVGAGHLAARRPRTLSGGEARRVAVARALASDPRLMLLDEPFASLDIESAVAMRSLLREVLKGRTAVLSTHDGLDAIDLAHTIAVLDHGIVVEGGATSATFEHPRTAFTAALAGLVWLSGTWVEGALTLADGQLVPAIGEGLTLGAAVAVTINPRAVKIVPPTTPGGVRDNVLALEPRGDGIVRVRCSALWADVSIAEASHFLPRVGEPAHFDVAARPHAFSLDS